MRLNFSKFVKNKFKKPLKKLKQNNKRHCFMQHSNEINGAMMLYQLAFIQNELLIAGKRRRLINHHILYATVYINIAIMSSQAQRPFD